MIDHHLLYCPTLVSVPETVPENTDCPLSSVPSVLDDLQHPAVAAADPGKNNITLVLYYLPVPSTPSFY